MNRRFATRRSLASRVDAEQQAEQDRAEATVIAEKRKRTELEPLTRIDARTRHRVHPELAGFAPRHRHPEATATERGHCG